MPTLPLDSQGVPYQGWDPATTYNATSGVAVTRGGVDVADSGNVSTATTNASTFVIAERTSSGVKRRSLHVFSQINAVLTVQVHMQVDGLDDSILIFTLPAGNATTQTVHLSSSGHSIQSGAGETVTTGVLAKLDDPGELIGVLLSTSGATTGVARVTLHQVT